MVGVALQTLRARWVTFVGTFVALTISVGMVAAMGLLIGATLNLPVRQPQRFAAAPVVVLAQDPKWDPAHHDFGTRSLAAAEGVPADLVTKLTALGRTVPDYSFYAQLAGGPTDQIGHAWTVAEFGGYGLTAGRAPVADNEIVLGDGNGAAQPGGTVTVLLADGPRTYTVVGLASVNKTAAYESAVFFTEAEAARLAPRIEALVVFAPDATVRQVVGNQAEVLLGDARRDADPGQAVDREALDNTSTILPITATVAGFVSVFVVASTFAFAVAQRRRELALLRAVGATPRQVRRMVVAEATLIGVLGSVAGCLVGVLAAPLLARWMINLGVAPVWFTVHTSLGSAWLPLALAFVIGLTVALIGVVGASNRAGAVRPIEALRDAAVDRSTMTTGRWIFGLGSLGLGLLLVAWVALSNPTLTLVPVRYIAILMLPILAFALLAPVVVGPIARLLTWPLRRLRGAGAMLVRESALTAVRRTAATAAPVLLTVGLGISLLGAGETINAAKDTGLRNGVQADFVIMPDGTPGLSQSVVDRVAKVDGVDSVAALPTKMYTTDGGYQQDYDVLTVDPAALNRVIQLPVTAGSVADLGAGTIVVDDGWDAGVGDSVSVQLADGRTAKFRVVAVLGPTAGNNVAYVDQSYAATARYAGTGLARRIYVKLRPGTDRATALAALSTATAGQGGKTVSVGNWIGAEKSDNKQVTALGMELVLGIAIVFCFIAIVNTLLMATADRRRDLAVLRLAGATPRQVVRVFAAESLLVVGVGVVLAVGASAVNLFGLRLALVQLVGSTPIVVPWGTVGLIVLISAVLAVCGAILPVRAALRTRAVELAGMHE